MRVRDGLVPLPSWSQCSVGLKLWKTHRAGRAPKGWSCRCWWVLQDSLGSSGLKVKHVPCVLVPWKFRFTGFKRKKQTQICVSERSLACDRAGSWALCFKYPWFCTCSQKKSGVRAKWSGQWGKKLLKPHWMNSWISFYVNLILLLSCYFAA